MQYLFNIVGLCLLATPLIWEIHNDRDGDAHLSRGLLRPYKILSKRLDVVTRITIAVLVSMINYYAAGASFWASLILSGSLHFLLFDYIIAYILIENKVVSSVNTHWFTYLGSKSVVDNWSFWKDQDPVSRLILRVLVFVTSLVVYF